MKAQLVQVLLADDDGDDGIVDDDDDSDDGHDYDGGDFGDDDDDGEDGEVMLVKAKLVKVFLSTGTVYNEYLSLHPEADPPPGGTK